MRGRLTDLLRRSVEALGRRTVRSDGRRPARPAREGPARERPARRGRTPKPPPSASPREPSAQGVLVIGGVSVEYTPRLDGDPDPGEIVWAWVPYEEDPRQGKDRPVVVIGRRGSGLVGVPLTSKRDDRDPQVPVGTGSWDRDRRVSYASLDRLVDIDPTTVRREGAILDRDRFDHVIDGLRRLHRAL